MNTAKTGGLMILLTVLLVIAGFLLTGSMVGATAALILSLLINLGMYWFSDRIALGMARAREVSDQEARELHGIVEEQVRLARIPKPRVYIIENDSPNAFATGRNPQHAAIAVTTGIQRLLNRNELGGVIAHELAHVGNRDTLIMAVAAAIAGAITWLAFMARWAMIFGGFGGRGGRGGGPQAFLGIAGLVAVAILLPLAAILIRLAISRAREYQADATGAKTSGTPWALADALAKLEQGSRQRPMKVNEAVSHLFIVNPLSGQTMARLFSSHPPIEERVKRLRSLQRF
ncbi:MAG: zinc metalloprotease HtpX [Dehalococcoidia bacterium]